MASNLTHLTHEAPKGARRPRLAAIEYIRGISMMGVIAIHVGSQYIENTMANAHLVALFEVASRFCVPIFFFISAFGLFYNLDPEKPLRYGAFLRRRAKAVLIPYLVWSLFYLVHDGILYGTGFPGPLHLLSTLFFGNAKYQLYFLVILLWFYLAMPLWIKIVRCLTIPRLAALLVLQIAFDFWSSYSVPFHLYVYGLPDGSLLKPFLLYRLNYWPMHYVFIFLLGGYLAVQQEAFRAFLAHRRAWLAAFFWATLAALLAHYYKLLAVDGYTEVEAINTAHQLAPEGILYTLAASLFFFGLFTHGRLPTWLHAVLHQLGRHSYFAYLVHPLFITYLALALRSTGRIMTAPVAIAFYLATLALSLCAAALFRKAGTWIPLLNELTIGIYPKRS